MIKICQECGKSFETSNGMQKFCNGQHFRICKICGEKFEVSRYHLTAKDAKVTCSRKCASELRKQTNITRYGGNAPASSEKIRKKMQQTNLERYGVEHAAQSNVILDKMKNTNKQRYGVEYYTQSDRGRVAVSDSWKDPEIRQRRLDNIMKTNMSRYGTKYSLSNPDIRNKARSTYFKKTGYYEPLANPDVQRKSESTNLKRLGVRRPIQSVKIKNKIKTTNLEKYGVENPVQNIDIQKKIKSTCMMRYGNTCFLQSDLGKEIVRKSMLSKYDHEWYSQSYTWKLDRMLDPSKIDNLLLFEQDPRKYILDNYDSKPNIRLLADDLGIHANTVGQKLIVNQCQDLVEYVYSYMENSVYNFIKSIDSKIVVERNTHKIITPYELDLYLPQYKIGIECNPTSTHNSSVNTFSKDEPPLKYDYHLMKTKKCEEQGIFLFHIFGSEWEYSTDIIKSMIRNLLGKSKRKIYARNCSVKELDSAVCRNFLNNNHRQGNVNSKVRLGLYLDGELVSVMTFGKMRQSIGTDGTDLSDCWELVRFCSILNTSVIGGASKLFKYFIDNWKPNRIRSFSDRAHTRGALYSKLGFNLVRYSDPGYVWVDSRTDISYHRYSAQKQNIRKFLHDDSIDLSKTEKQIMEENGFLQVFDCGTLLWEWCKN